MLRLASSRAVAVSRRVFASQTAARAMSTKGDVILPKNEFTGTQEMSAAHQACSPPPLPILRANVASSHSDAQSSPRTKRHGAWFLCTHTNCRAHPWLKICSRPAAVSPCRIWHGLPLFAPSPAPAVPSSMQGRVLTPSLCRSPSRSSNSPQTLRVPLPPSERRMPPGPPSRWLARPLL
jgi:hypothetical protein